MTEVVLTVPLRTPSGNQLSGYHWRKRHRMRRDWMYGVLAAMRAAGARLQLDPVDVVIERYAALPIRDLDNAQAGLKPVLDGMVQAGLIVDDSSAYVVSITIRQLKAPRGCERTVIRLRPAFQGSRSPTSGPA